MIEFRRHFGSSCTLIASLHLLPAPPPELRCDPDVHETEVHRRLLRELPNHHGQWKGGFASSEMMEFVWADLCDSDGKPLHVFSRKLMQQMLLLGPCGVQEQVARQAKPTLVPWAANKISGGTPTGQLYVVPCM